MEGQGVVEEEEGQEGGQGEEVEEVEGGGCSPTFPRTCSTCWSTRRGSTLSEPHRPADQFTAR